MLTKQQRQQRSLWLPPLPLFILLILACCCACPSYPTAQVKVEDLEVDGSPFWTLWGVPAVSMHGGIPEVPAAVLIFLVPLLPLSLYPILPCAGRGGGLGG
jgi:hypothetical protein